MTLLSACKDAAYEVGMEAPTSIISNTDPIALQLLRFAQKEGYSLAQMGWNRLISEGSITLVTSDQDYALPSDFNYQIADTTWNRSDKRKVLTPLTSKEWQFYKGLVTVNGIHMRARIRANELEFENTIGAGDNGESIYYEYLSTFWVIATGGSAPTKAAFTVDTDFTIWDDELLTQGIVWRFKKAKGFDWQADFQEYNMLKNRMFANDGGMRDIDMKGNEHTILTANIVDRDFT